MPNTYTQLYNHYVIVVRYRSFVIHKSWTNDLYKYMSGIIERQGHKMYIINGMPDHVHILVSMSPNQAPSDLMYNVKRSSSLWINEHRLTSGRFAWQEGFGAFSVGKSQLPYKIKYIERQEQHHRKTTFLEEYLKFLEEYEIAYDERYVFKPLE